MPRPVGVLLVHGVGSSQRRASLREVGEPIFAWLNRWLGDSGTDPVGGPVEYATTPKATTEGNAPKHLQFRRQGSDREVVVVNSGWTEELERPTFRELADWMLGVGPWIVQEYCNRRARVLQSQAQSLDQHATSPGAVLFLGLYGFQIIVALLGFVLLIVWAGLVLGVALQIVMVVLLLFGTLPRLRGLVSGVQLWLTGWLGDTYLLASSSSRFAGMIAQVRSELAWLAERCDEVIVVGHSQGATVARVAVGFADAPVRAFVTAGTAEQKLHVLTEALNQRGRLAWSATLRLAGVAAFVGAALTNWSLPSAVLLLVGVIAFFAGLVISTPNVRDLTPQDLHLANAEAITWRDYYASADPVPDGPLIANPSAWPSSTMVRNRGSVLRDHGSYFRNQEEFVSVIAREVAGRAGWDLGNSVEQVLRLAQARRSKRVDALVAEKLVAVVTVLFAVWGLWRWLPDLGSPLATVGGFLAGAIPDVKADEAEAFLRRQGPDVVTGSLAMMVLLGVWRLIASGQAWREWDTVEASRMFERRPGEALGGWAPVFAILVTVPPLAVAALSVVAHWPPSEQAVAASVIFALVVVVMTWGPTTDAWRATTDTKADAAD